MLPGEPAEIPEPDLIGGCSPIRFDPPEQIGTAPRPQTVTSRGAPPEAHQFSWLTAFLAGSPVSGVA